MTQSFIEIVGVRPKSNLSLATSTYLAPDAKLSYEGSNGLHHWNLRQKLHYDTEFHCKGPPKIEATSIWLLTPNYHMKGQTDFTIGIYA